MRVWATVGLIVMLSASAGAVEPAGGLPAPADERQPPKFGFKAVEKQPRLPEPIERPNPNELPRTTLQDNLPPPRVIAPAPVTVVPDPGLRVRQQGDVTLHGRRPQLRRYGDLPGRSSDQ